jgi:hypothetical protein
MDALAVDKRHSKPERQSGGSPAAHQPGFGTGAARHPGQRATSIVNPGSADLERHARTPPPPRIGAFKPALPNRARQLQKLLSTKMPRIEKTTMYE